MYPKRDKRRSRDLIKLTRKDMHTVVVLLTAHVLLDRYEKMLDISTNNFCRRCRQEEALLLRMLHIKRGRLKSLGVSTFGLLSEIAVANILQILHFPLISGWVSLRSSVV